MSTLSQIESEIASLPNNLRAEVLDYVRFIKHRHANAPGQRGGTPPAGSGDSPFFQALNDAGFVACIETNEQLSTAYKDELDFSDKLGTRP